MTINTSEGDLCPYIFVGLVSLSRTEVHPRAANAGESIKAVDSVVPYMNRWPTVAA